MRRTGPECICAISEASRSRCLAYRQTPDDHRAAHSAGDARHSSEARTCEIGQVSRGGRIVLDGCLDQPLVGSRRQKVRQVPIASLAELSQGRKIDH